MDDIAKWLGYIKAVNYTGKLAYFKLVGSSRDMKFIVRVKDFNPKINNEIFITVVDYAVQQGAEISVHRKAVKTSKYINIEAVMSINNQIYRSLGANIRTAIVNCIQKYVNNLNH